MPFFLRRSTLASGLVALCVAASACKGKPSGQHDAGLDAQMRPGDAQSDGARPPLTDGQRPCTSNDDCHDEIPCTQDLCDPLGYCRNPIDLAMCDDGIFCNGVEQCDLRRGCVPGPPETCNDDDVCTIDVCDEPHKTCAHNPRDFDEDGEADWHCPSGTDCDDRNPNRGMTIAEVCGDGVDNDCDDHIDESDCGGPPHDTCADPLDVSMGGSFTVSTIGASSNYPLTCGGAGWKDIVLHLNLTASHDVHITAQADATLTAIGIKTECGGPSAALSCNSGFPADVRRRSMDAGDYYIIVTSLTGSSITVTVDLGPPTVAPTNESCGTAQDISAGGMVTGNFTDVRNDLATSCGPAGAPDLVYTFTTHDVKNVMVTATSSTGDSLNFSVQSTCGVETTSLRCSAGAPAQTTLHQLPAGTYFIVLEGQTSRAVDFTLDVEFSTPTAPADGDTCSNPIALTLGTPMMGTLEGKEDDVRASCVFGYRDAIYSFTLTADSDVLAVVDGAGRLMGVSVRGTCADAASERSCSTGTPGRARLHHLAAGMYYLVVESMTAAPFTVTVTATPPATPVAVTMNDTCGEAHVIPPTGGLFTGTTVTAINDYSASCGGMAHSADVVYSLTLTAMKRVVASTEGSLYDTVLYMYRDSCGVSPEYACNDDDSGLSTSLIERVLAPGTYYYVVDGFGTTSVGEYTLEVMVTDP